MDQLNGRTALVTGAASGIGLAMTQAFIAEGMNVVMVDVESDRLEKAARELRASGANIITAVVDVSKAHQVQSLAERVDAEFGPVHLLCNNAGVEVIGATWEQTLDDWRWVIDVNLWGVIHGVHTFLPRMRASGQECHIVNTASMAGLSSAAYMSSYNVTKFGVVALSETLYKELAHEGSKVGVSVVCPGLIKTHILESRRNRPGDHPDEGTFGEASQGFRAALSAGVQSGYEPAEVARQVVEAVKEGHFYVIPAQEQVFKGALTRMDDIKHGRNPTVR